MTGREVLRSVLDLLLPPAFLRCRARIPIPSPPAAPEDLLLCRRCLAGLTPPPAPRCERCGFPLGTGRAFVGACLQCRDWDPALGRARAAVLDRGTGAVMVRGLKYHGWEALSREMGKAMVREGRGKVLLPGSVVVPIPTTPRRRARRGYDQAELLAREVAARSGNPLRHTLLRRGDGRSQVGLHPQERWTNVRDAFAATGPGREAVHGASVLLVDDVLTTGATLCSAARTLVEAGAARVDALVFARAQPDLDTI
jgi:ComF family protein